MIGSVLAEEAAGLNRTENVEKDEANSTRLWEQVAAMLETIKLVNLSQANASVSTELRSVNVSNTVSSHTGAIDYRPCSVFGIIKTEEIFIKYLSVIIITRLT